MVLETHEVIMRWTIIGVGLVAIAGITMMMARALRQNQMLRDWRAGLKRGDLVRTKQFPRAYVWVNYGNIVSLQVGDMYRRVRRGEIYPVEDKWVLLP